MSKEVMKKNNLHKGQKVLHAVHHGTPSIEVLEICDAEMIPDYHVQYADGSPTRFLGVFCYEYDQQGNKVRGTGYYERSELLTLDDVRVWLSEEGNID